MISFFILSSERVLHLFFVLECLRYITAVQLQAANLQGWNLYGSSQFEGILAQGYETGFQQCIATDFYEL